MKKKLRISHVIIGLIALAGVISLCLGQFWGLHLNWKIDNESMREFAGETDETAERIPIDAEIDFTLKFDSQMLLKGVFTDNQTTVKTFVASCTSDAVEQLENIVGEILKVGACYATSDVIDSMAEEGVITEQKRQEIYDNIEKKNVFETTKELLSENPDMDIIKKNVYLNAEQSMAEAGEVLDDQKKAELKAEIDESVDQIVDAYKDEEGNFNMYMVMEDVISEMIGVEFETDADGRFTKAKFADAVGEMVAESLDSETLNLLATIFKALGVLVLIPIVCWGLLFLSALVKVVRKKGYVYPTFSSLVGIFPYAVLVLLPNILIASGLEILYQDPQLAGLLNKFTIKLEATTIISAICGVILILFDFVYGHWRRVDKKIQKRGYRG